MRSSVLMASIAVVLWSSVARAEGPAKASALPPPAETPEFVGVKSLVTGSKVLGDAWSRALRAVADKMNQLLDAERAAAARALAQQAVPRARAAEWSAPPPPPSAPAGEPPARLGPVAVAPVTEAVADTRGEHAILLGTTLELPWLLP